jgi:hypothetical protein
MYCGSVFFVYFRLELIVRTPILWFRIKMSIKYEVRYHIDIIYFCRLLLGF